MFYRDGDLIAFPSLDRLALFASVDEKTIRNGRDRLEAAGLLRIQHRFDNSNFYCLTIPAEAENHLFHCEIVLKRLPKSPTRAPVENDTKFQLRTRNLVLKWGVKTIPSCQLPLTLPLNTLMRLARIARLPARSQGLKRKRLGEEERKKLKRRRALNSSATNLKAVKPTQAKPLMMSAAPK